MKLIKLYLEHMLKYLRLSCVFLVFFISLTYGILSAQEFRGVYRDKDDNPHVAFLDLGYANWGTEEEPEIVWAISIYSPNSEEVHQTIFFSENTQWRYDEIIKTGSQTLKNVYSLFKSGDNQIYQFYNLDGANHLIPTISFMSNSKEGIGFQFQAPRDQQTFEDFYKAIDNAITSIPFSKRNK